MKRVLFLSLLLALGFGAACGAKELPRTCSGPECGIVAKVLEWPESASVENGTSVLFGPFRLRLPDGIRHIGVSSVDPIWHVDYEDGTFIFEIITREQIERRLGVDLDKATIAVADLPRITFLETNKSKEPDEMVDLTLWRWALRQKRFLVTEESSHARRSDIDFYITGRSEMSDFDSYSAVTRQLYSDIFLIISGKNKSVIDLKNVLLTVELNTE